MLGSGLVLVAMWLGVGMLLLLLSRRCAIGLAEPALRRVGPAMRKKPWPSRHRPFYRGIEGWQMSLEAAQG